MHPFPRRGLYAVTPEDLSGSALAEAVAAAIAGGARAVQFRRKSGDREQRRSDAERLVTVCREHSVPLIVNDDPELARTVHADGVHVGREDETLEQARALLGTEAIVGVSCYDRPQRALAAHAGGASYVAFGSFFPSPTKPGAVRATLDLIREVKPAITVPIVAIGGITPENAGALLAGGVDVVAVVSAIFGASDPYRGAHAFQTLFRGER